MFAMLRSITFFSPSFECALRFPAALRPRTLAAPLRGVTAIGGPSAHLRASFLSYSRAHDAQSAAGCGIASGVPLTERPYMTAAVLFSIGRVVCADADVDLTVKVAGPRGDDRAAGPGLAAQGQVGHPRQIPGAPALPCRVPASLAPSHHAPRAASAAAARCFRVACASPACDPEAALLSIIASRPPLSQMRAVAPVADFAAGAATASGDLGPPTPVAARLPPGGGRAVFARQRARLPARHGRRARRLCAASALCACCLVVFPHFSSCSVVICCVGFVEAHRRIFA
jgi:hypothetical protein